MTGPKGRCIQYDPIKTTQSTVSEKIYFLIAAFAVPGDVNFEVKGRIKQHGAGHAVASGAQKDG